MNCTIVTNEFCPVFTIFFNFRALNVYLPQRYARIYLWKIGWILNEIWKRKKVQTEKQQVTIKWASSLENNIVSLNVMQTIYDSFHSHDIFESGLVNFDYQIVDRLFYNCETNHYLSAPIPNVSLCIEWSQTVSTQVVTFLNCAINTHTNTHTHKWWDIYRTFSSTLKYFCLLQILVIKINK